MNTRQLEAPAAAFPLEIGATNPCYDEQTIQAVWLKAKPAPGWASFRKDATGAVIHRRMYGIPDKWGWRIARIEPLENGGSDELRQPPGRSLGEELTPCNTATHSLNFGRSTSP